MPKEAQKTFCSNNRKVDDSINDENEILASSISINFVPDERANI